MNLLIAYLLLSVGELVPERLVRSHPIAIEGILAPGVTVLASIIRPMLWLLSVSTNAMVRLLGRAPHVEAQAVSAVELRGLIVSQPGLRDDSRSILADVFRAGDRHLVQAMRARPMWTFSTAGNRAASGSFPVLNVLTTMRRKNQEIALVLEVDLI